VATATQLAAALIGCVALDTKGRRLGRVVAVIHKARGADVLVEGRVWLRRRSYRFPVDAITRIDARHLRCDPSHTYDSAVNEVRAVAEARRR
jgi:hypothetical protein